MINGFNPDFYKGKTVFVTGHTGFKGSWLCEMLLIFGAKVVGYALPAPTSPSLFDLLGLKERMVSIEGDVRDYEKLKAAIEQYQPEIVIHLAAQPLVRLSYSEPAYTYETNVMGTVNLLEAVRVTSCVKSLLNVTTDKVYYNPENSAHAFKEDEPLDGYDPYSNSKSCSELVTHSYKKSFFDERRLPVSTARAGNVIGGGDFAADRILPDAVRSIEKGQTMFVRNPNSTRPYQHVLEPLLAYLLICQKQYQDFAYAGYYNVGPDEVDCVTTGELMDRFSAIYGQGFSWEKRSDNGPHEANFLRLDCSKIKKTFSWRPSTHIDEALALIAKWTKVYLRGDKKQIKKETDEEIAWFLSR